MKIPTFERRNGIMKLLLKQGFVKAQELSVYYQVSMETIRKDLVAFEEAGIVQKEYGGASLTMIEEEHSLSLRMENSAKKKQIAHCAIHLLDDAKTVFMDAGTTVHEVAKLMKNVRPLDIVTNSLLVWETLDSNHHNVFLSGGKKREKNMSLTGHWCTQAIASVHGDLCFLGTSGIFDRQGPTTHSYQELEAKMMMIRQSDRVYVLADSDKFKESGFHTLCSWKDIDGIITDHALPSKVYEQYQKIVPIYIAQEEIDAKDS